MNTIRTLTSITLLCLVQACSTRQLTSFRITHFVVEDVPATRGVNVTVEGLGATPGGVVEIWIERTLGDQTSQPFRLQLGLQGSVPPGVNADNLGAFRYKKYEPCQGGEGISKADVTRVFATDRGTGRDSNRTNYTGDFIKCR